jgi:zinc finger protein
MQLKPGGRIPEKGKTITLCVKNANDLSRDVIKVCSCLLYSLFFFVIQ